MAEDDSDSAILDRIEVIIDTMTTQFYSLSNDEGKRQVATFSMGMVAGELMRRNKNAN